MSVHIDQNPGFMPGARRWSQRRNVTGEAYWHVEEDIGYMPFSDRPVHGKIEAFGRTQNEAEARLQEERKNLWTHFGNNTMKTKPITAEHIDRLFNDQSKGDDKGTHEEWRAAAVRYRAMYDVKCNELSALRLHVASLITGNGMQQFALQELKQWLDEKK